MTNLKNVLNIYKCISLSNCGRNKTFVSHFWLFGGLSTGGTTKRRSYMHEVLHLKSRLNHPPTPQKSLPHRYVEQDELFYSISVHFGDNLTFSHTFLYMTVSRTLGYLCRHSIHMQPHIKIKLAKNLISYTRSHIQKRNEQVVACWRQ